MESPKSTVSISKKNFHQKIFWEELFVEIVGSQVKRAGDTK